MLLDNGYSEQEKREESFWRVILKAIPVNDQIIIARIVQRAVEMQKARGGEIGVDPITHMMQICLCHVRICPLRLTDFLHGDAGAFVQDYVAITTKVIRDERDWTKAYLFDYHPIFATRPHPGAH